MALYKWLATFARLPSQIIENRPFGPLYSNDQPLQVLVHADTEAEARQKALERLHIGDSPSDEPILAPRSGLPSTSYTIVSVKKIK